MINNLFNKKGLLPSLFFLYNLLIGYTLSEKIIILYVSLFCSGIIRGLIYGGNVLTKAFLIFFLLYLSNGILYEVIIKKINKLRISHLLMIIALLLISVPNYINNANKPITLLYVDIKDRLIKYNTEFTPIKLFVLICIIVIGLFASSILFDFNIIPNKYIINSIRYTQYLLSSML